MNTQTSLSVPSELVDQRTLADLLHVSYGTLRRHVTAKSPHIPAPAGRVGRAYVWRRADIDIPAIQAAWPRMGRPPKRGSTAA